MSRLWHRFTERGKRVVIAGQETAASMGHPLMTPEHILLGLVKEGDSVATKVMERLGVLPDRVQEELERKLDTGSRQPITGDSVSMGRRAILVVDHAYEESKWSSTNYVGTEHVFLGILREGEGTAYETLVGLGFSLDSVRKEVIRYLGGEQAQPRSRTSPVPVRPEMVFHVAKFADAREGEAWLNSMAERGCALKEASTSDGELWLIVEGPAEGPGAGGSEQVG